MKACKNIFLFFSFIFLLGSYITEAQSNITIVSNAPNLQYHSDIDDNYVVYWSNQNPSNQHIYLYKISDSSTTKITSVNSAKGYPKISGNYVVWSDSRNGNKDIFFYDISQPQLGDRSLIVRSYDQDVWDFDGTKLLLMDYQGDFPNYNFRLLCYDISTSEETLIKEDVYPNIHSASISGNLVVYDYNSDIYLYNLFTQETTVICDHPAEQKNPCVSDGPFDWKIVWEDNRNGDWDLYQCNLYYWQSGAHIKDFPVSFLWWETYNPVRSNQKMPHIKKNMLVFTDDISGNDEIYLMNYLNSLIGPVTRISFSDYINCEPITDGNNIVWWDDKDPNPNIISKSDVYLWQRPQGADLSVSIKAVKTKLQIDEPVTLSFCVSNFGPLTATNVIFSDTLSNMIQIFSATSDAGNVIINPNNVVTFNIDNLPADSSVTITITGKAIYSGKAKIYGSVTSNQLDYLPSNNRCNITLNISDFQSYSLDFPEVSTKPKIKVDKNGSIHILSFTEFPVLLTYATNKTGAWTQEIIEKTKGDLFLIGADLDIDEQSNAHIVYVLSPYGQSYPNQTLYYTNNTSGHWQSTLPLGTMSGQMTLPVIRIDSNNKVHIAFITNIWDGSIYYFNNINGSWSLPEFISNGYKFYSMDIDKNNFIHFASYNINSGPFYITNKPDNVWHTPETVDQNWTGGQLETLVLDLVVDLSSTPHISYVGNYINKEDYKYAIKINNNWQNYFVDTCGFIGGYNALALDNNANPYLIYVAPNSNELRCAKKEGDIFSKKIIAYDFEDFISNSFDIDSDPSNYIHFVYYKDGLNYGTNSPYMISFGGGDDNSGGYFFANSISSGAQSQPGYNWYDPISFGHTEITDWSLGNADDGYLGPIDLPFSFQFFSSFYNQIYINSNGYLSFLKGYLLTAENSTVPNVFEPNNFIAACASDLNLDYNLHSDSKTYYGIVGDKFVVTFIHAYAKNSPTDYISFQIILYPNGNILFQYNDLESTTPLAPYFENEVLIGIENEIGTKGICYRNNGVGGPIFSSPLAVMFGKNSLLLPVDEETLNIPTQFLLHQNYPNPFNPSTKIRFAIPTSPQSPPWQGGEAKLGWLVTLKVYDILGNEIATLVNEEKPAGEYEVEFYAVSLASGVYFYQLKAGSFVETKKMLLLK